MKRKASEDVSAQPTKAARSSEADEDQHEDGRNGPSEDANKPENGDNGSLSDENGEKAEVRDETRKSVEERKAEQQPTENQSAGVAATQKDQSLAENQLPAQDQTRGKNQTPAENQPDEATATKKHQPPDQSKSDPAEAQREINKGIAKEMIEHLQLVLDGWWITQGDHLHPVESARLLDGMTKLCRFAMQDGVRRNPFLGSLRGPFWADMKAVSEHVERANELKEQLEQRRSELERCRDDFDAAALKRGQALIGIGDRTKEAKQANNKKVSDAAGQLYAARDAWSKARVHLDHQIRAMRAKADDPLREAEEGLVAEGYLIEAERFEYDAGPDQEQVAAEDARGEENRPRRELNAKAYSFAEGPSTVAARTRNAPGSLGRAANGREEEMQSFADEVRGDTRAELNKARKAWSEASREFHGVRDGYRPSLAAFLEAKRKEQVKGTKTDFDQAYFLRRNRANHKSAAAQKDYEYALEVADEAEALTVEQRCRYFEDEARGDRVSGVIDIENDPIWMETAQHIGKWKTQQEGIVDKLDGRAAQSERAQEGGVSLDGFEDLEMRQSMFTGKRRRAIDDWQKQQADVRKSLTLLSQPSLENSG